MKLDLSRTSHLKDMEPGYKYSKWFVQRTTQLGPIGISLRVCWAQNSLISDKKLTSKSLRIQDPRIPLRMVPLKLFWKLFLIFRSKNHVLNGRISKNGLVDQNEIKLFKFYFSSRFFTCTVRSFWYDPFLERFLWRSQKVFQLFRVKN